MNPEPGAPADGGERSGGSERWREEFPYHWGAEERVGRRHFLGLAVLTSAAVFVSTIGLAIRGLFDDRRRGNPRVIARVDDVAEGQAMYFNYPGPDDQAVLIHLPGQNFVAFSQKCTHLSCSVYYQADENRLLCPCHRGIFDPLTGEPTAGPPRRRLPRIILRRQGDTLVAVEEAP